jgi:cytochrome o ubiquinol oxidase subunit 1
MQDVNIRPVERTVMFGKLDLSAIPLSQPIPLITSAAVVLIALGILVLVTVKGRWPYIWHEWITSVDHKRIGVMYCLLGGLMLIRGFADAIMMRTQQAVAVNAEGYLPPEHYNQIFSAHGTIMILFGAMPLVLGFMNFLVPLQLGVRDVAFPTFNSVGFWLTASGALLVNVSLFIGEFARTGWLPYPPLSETSYSPGVGVDYYLWAVQISGVGTLITGINIVTTVLKMRCPGMSYLRMPVFTWTSLASCLLIVAAFPILTATLAMLTLDRYVGWHYFTNTAGGNPMMFVNLIWAWGHPEVYILVLPCFGIFSEIFSTFSGKPLFGYRSMVAATLFICVVSMMVWLHHFFTMGAGPGVNTFFGISSSVIAVGTGVKIYNWIFTMYGGRVRFEVPMLWSMGFIFTFIIGGLTGVLLAIPPADFITHNSMFLVAHFHNVIVGGVVFGLFAGMEFWFPKAFGFRLHEGWGKAAFWFAFIGFWVTFAPLYILGLDGMTRRLQHINFEAWSPWLDVSLVGVLILALGVVSQIVQLVVSIRNRERLRDTTGDPWDGRSLEWATPSPPPFFNFAVMPNVEGEEAYWGIKLRAIETQQLAPEPEYAAIEMPLHNPVGIYTAFFSAVFGFAMIWYIWWLAIAAMVAAFIGFVVFAWRDVHEFEVPAEELAKAERTRRAAREALLQRLLPQGGAT